MLSKSTFKIGLGLQDSYPAEDSLSLGLEHCFHICKLKVLNMKHFWAAFLRIYVRIISFLRWDIKALAQNEA